MTYRDQSSPSVSSQPRPRIKVSVRQTRNLQDYNSMSYEFTVEDDVPEGKKISTFIQETTSNIEKLLEKKLMEYGFTSE